MIFEKYNSGGSDYVLEDDVLKAANEIFEPWEINKNQIKDIISWNKIKDEDGDLKFEEFKILMTELNHMLNSYEEFYKHNWLPFNLHKWFTYPEKLKIDQILQLWPFISSELNSKSGLYMLAK